MKFIESKFSLKDYKDYDHQDRKVYLLEEQDCDNLLNKFYSKLLDQISKREHFPIIRLADGEFQFLLGKNEFNTRKPVFLLIRNILGELYRKLRRVNFEARSRTYTSGVYSKNDLANVREIYSKCLRFISERGMMAIYTIIKPKFYTEHYIPKLIRFFDENNIELNNSNYVPFYFIYIILTNKRYSHIYNAKNIHLITSFDEERKRKIEKTLYSLNVKNVSWTKISKDRSLFNEINKNMIPKDIDIIFIGAGVGKVNIFNQLKGIPCLVIDAGYIFETWQNPSLCDERDYCKTHNDE